MADSLLAWINRLLDDPKTFEKQLNGRSVLVYEPPTEAKEDTTGAHRLRTSSGVTASVIGGGDPVVALLEKSKDNMFQRRGTMGRANKKHIVLHDTSVARLPRVVPRAEASSKRA